MCSVLLWSLLIGLLTVLLSELLGVWCGAVLAAEWAALLCALAILSFLTADHFFEIDLQVCMVMETQVQVPLKVLPRLLDLLPDL